MGVNKGLLVCWMHQWGAVQKVNHIKTILQSYCTALMSGIFACCSVHFRWVVGWSMSPWSGLCELLILKQSSYVAPHRVYHNLHMKVMSSIPLSSMAIYSYQMMCFLRLCRIITNTQLYHIYSIYDTYVWYILYMHWIYDILYLAICHIHHMDEKSQENPIKNEHIFFLNKTFSKPLSPLHEGHKNCPTNCTMPLTHWSRDKMAAIFKTTLSNAFSWMKMLEFRLSFHWSLFLRVHLTIIQHWFR